MAAAFVDSAKVMSKGQVTIPKDIREVLGISCGDRVTFIVDENGTVHLMNSAIYAMKLLQENMSGVAQKTGLNSEEDVIDLIAEMRNEE